MTVTIHGMPNRSETMPNPLVQNVRCHAIRIVPPSLSAVNIFSPDSTSSADIEILKPEKTCGVAFTPSVAMIRLDPILNVACMTLPSQSGVAFTPSGESLKCMTDNVSAPSAFW